MIDSGFRCGTDVVKALALGADFVFAGRPFNYAASVGGAAGVRKAARMLKTEIDMAIGMLGVTTLKELSPEHLMTREQTFV